MPPSSHDITSVEGQILRREIHNIGTTVIREVQELKTEQGNQSELLGRLWGKLETLYEMVERVINPAPNGNGAVHKVPAVKLSVGVPMTDKPSIPPPARDVVGLRIEGTDTGNYKLDPQLMEQVSKRVAKIERDKHDADVRAARDKELAEEAEKRTTRAEKRTRFVVFLASSVAGAVVGGAALVEWLLHHMH